MNEKADDKGRPTLKKALADLEEAITRTLSYFDALDPGDLMSHLSAFKLLHECSDILEREHKIFNHLYDRMSYEVIPDLMETEEIDSVKRHGRNFVLMTRTLANIPQAKQDAGYAWLKEHGADALIQPKVNSKSLSSFIDSYFKEHAIMPPEEAIDVIQKRYISVRKG